MPTLETYAPGQINTEQTTIMLAFHSLHVCDVILIAVLAALYFLNISEHVVTALVHQRAVQDCVHGLWLPSTYLLRASGSSSS